MRLQLCVIAFVACAVASTAAAAPVDGAFDSAGVRIHYIEDGRGDAVVLVHGFMNTAEDWVRVGIFPELAKRYRVIALDCRGHGQSDKPHDPTLYGREVAEDVIRLLDHLRLARAHVVGYSMGGGIVAQLVTLHPDRFLSATLGGNAGRRRWTAADQEDARIEADELRRGSLRHILTRLSPTNAAPPSEEEIRERSAAVLKGQDPLALAALEQSRGSFVVDTRQLAATKVPVLGIVGSLDPSLSSFQELKTAMPQLELVVIDGAPHSGATGAPRRPEFVRSLSGFLARTSQAAPNAVH